MKKGKLFNGQLVGNNFKDIGGLKFGKLSVIELVGIKRLPNRSIAIWKCKCECGKEVEKQSDYITHSNAASCGCDMYTNSIKASTTHNLSYHLLYRVWLSMINRCHNPKVEKYEIYGKRGISVCGEWRGDFKPFYDWMISNGWRKGLQIDRKNNDGNYEPNNCRLVNPKENARNTRATILNGWVVRVARNLREKQGMKIMAISRLFNIPDNTLRHALAYKTWIITDEEKEQERQRILSQTSLIQ